MVDRAITPGQARAMIMEEAREAGFDWFQPYHAAAMSGSFMQETGNYRSDVINFEVRGDQGTAHGLMQWRGQRWQNLQKYARENNLDVKDVRTQIAFAIEEMKAGSEYADFGSVRAAREMRRTDSLEEATIAFIHAERPAGWSLDNPSGAHDTQRRIQFAQQTMGSDAGSAVQGPNDQSTTRAASGNEAQQELFSQEIVRRLGSQGFNVLDIPSFGLPMQSENLNGVQPPVPVAPTGNPLLDQAAQRFGIVPSTGEVGALSGNPYQLNAPNPAASLAGGDSYIRYANQNAVRNDPLSPELVQALSFLGDMGITMEVSSGGQENNTTQGLGSTRHNHGNAADVFFYDSSGRRLDWGNEADLPIIQEILARAYQNGVRGLGAGPNYMQQGSVHLGFGDEAVWGEGGKGVNAPQWLRDVVENPNRFITTSSQYNNNRPQVSAEPVQTTTNFGSFETPQETRQPLDFGLPSNPVTDLPSFDLNNNLTFGEEFDNTENNFNSFGF